jgi:hypothetical protein
LREGVKVVTTFVCKLVFLLGGGNSKALGVRKIMQLALND